MMFILYLMYQNCLVAKPVASEYQRLLYGAKSVTSSTGVMMHRICQECGIQCDTNNWREKYCTDICADKSRKKTQSIISLRSERKRNGTYEKWAGFLRDGGYLVIRYDELARIQKTGKSVWYI